MYSANLPFATLNSVSGGADGKERVKNVSLLLLSPRSFKTWNHHIADGRVLIPEDKSSAQYEAEIRENTLGDKYLRDLEQQVAAVQSRSRSHAV